MYLIAVEGHGERGSPSGAGNRLPTASQTSRQVLEITLSILSIEGRISFLEALGLAVGRALIAVLENGQAEDGGVILPQALSPWLRGKTRITPEGDLV